MSFPVFCSNRTQRQVEDMRKKVELLAPAGNMEAFRGAVNAGADAVYLAGQQFGARAYADNFTREELTDAIRRAHLSGIRVYLTVNILTRQEELQELESFVFGIYEAGLDGVIVQDLGTAAMLRRKCPGLELHASTQMSVAGKEAVRFLKRQGFVRVVPARELSLQEIRLLKEEDIEVESFIHGAMCYSYSGRCLMSSFLGGRSGNRGRCAGTCRLPYTIVDENRNPLGGDGACYPLSMRDMCVLPILPELIDAGIDSFKIEGRMKKPEYAAGTTAIYRKYIDRFYAWDQKGRPGKWKIEKEDLQRLQNLYIRTELCQGYYHTRNGRGMVTICEPGYRGADPELLKKIRSAYLEEDRKLDICGCAVVLPGEKAQLRVWPSEVGERPENAESESEGTVQEARSRALTEEEIREKLAKTGNSPFRFQELQVITDGRAFLPVSALGELRRSALEKLLQRLTSGKKQERGENLQTDPRAAKSMTDCAADDGKSAGAGWQKEPPCRDEAAADTGLMVMVQNAEQAMAALSWSRRNSVEMELILDAKAREECDAILKEISREGIEGEESIRVLAALPYMLRESDRRWMQIFYEKYHDKFYGFVTRTLEELEILIKEEYNDKVIVDSTLYVWNRESEAVLQNSVPKARNFQIVLPAELSGKELYQTFSHASAKETSLSDKILTVYGRTPLMVSANCVRKTVGQCLLKNKGETGKSGGCCGLEDRTGAVFPVWTDCIHCQNVVYNSVPTSLHKFRKDALFSELGAILVSFTVEDAKDVMKILDIFGKSAGEALEGRAQQEQLCREVLESSGFTNGHFKKGAM